MLCPPASGDSLLLSLSTIVALPAAPEGSHPGLVLWWLARLEMSSVLSEHFQGQAVDQHELISAGVVSSRWPVSGLARGPCS